MLVDCLFMETGSTKTLGGFGSRGGTYAVVEGDPVTETVRNPVKIKGNVMAVRVQHMVLLFSILTRFLTTNKSFGIKPSSGQFKTNGSQIVRNGKNI